MYEFTKDCMIGIKEIDDEHKKLFDMINDAIALAGKTEDVMCIILSIGLLFGESDTNASTKSPLIYAGSENITGGKYTLGQKT